MRRMYMRESIFIAKVSNKITKIKFSYVFRGIFFCIYEKHENPISICDLFARIRKNCWYVLCPEFKVSHKTIQQNA